MKFTGIIIAAGKQNRFDGNIPKALMPFKDSTLLEYNLKTMDFYCNNICVFCSLNDYDLFSRYSNNKINVIPIESGLGCGDAVMRALLCPQVKEQNIVQIWGDSIQTNDIIYQQAIIKYLDYYPCYDFVMPVVKEEKPYVLINVNNNNVIDNVIFSKYNSDKIVGGFHDLSLFVYNKSCLNIIFNDIFNKFYNKDKYTMRDNGEFTFLDIFNNNYKIKSTIVDIKNVRSLSFNTIDEYKKAIKF